MKINEYNAGSKVNAYMGEAKKVSGEDRPGLQAEVQGASTSQGDQVHLSTRSREIVRVREMVEAAPAVRPDKVAAIKAQLAAGVYEVKPEVVAEKMMLTQLSEKV